HSQEQPSPQPMPQETKAATAAAAPAEGLKFTLATAKKQYRAGEAEDLIPTTDDKPREALSYGEDKVHEMSGPQGTAPDRKEADRLAADGEPVHGNALIPVPPGGTATIKEGLQAINLPRPPGEGPFLRHRYFRMDVPGTYRVRLELGKGTCNELAIE